MCTYSFQQVVCSCAKGAACPQMALGRAVVGGEVFHHVDMFYAIDDLGAACDYQRRLYGRGAQPTMHCPRYAFDEKRIIKGSYKKSDLACVKCAETCAPPSTSWQAPGPQHQQQQQQQQQLGLRTTGDDKDRDRERDGVSRGSG